MVQYAPMSSREEDLAEALRRIVVCLQPDGDFAPSDREWAALAIACDALDIDLPGLAWDELLNAG